MRAAPLRRAVRALTRARSAADGAASYVPAIVLERRLYMRERADGLYYAITYLLAKLLDELMVATLASLPLCAASFYAIDFQNSFALFWYGARAAAPRRAAGRQHVFL